MSDNEGTTMERALNDTRHAESMEFQSQAKMAEFYAKTAIHKDSGMGVGAVVCINVEDQGYKPFQLYAASNVHYSGMEYKAHAEQVALRQALLDIQANNVDADISNVVVVTGTDTKDLVCGHCLQVFHGACKVLGTDLESTDIEYVAAQRNEDDSFDFRVEYLTELLPNTYINYNEKSE